MAKPMKHVQAVELMYWGFESASTFPYPQQGIVLASGVKIVLTSLSRSGRKTRVASTCHGCTLMTFDYGSSDYEGVCAYCEEVDLFGTSASRAHDDGTSTEERLTAVLSLSENPWEAILTARELMEEIALIEEAAARINAPLESTAPNYFTKRLERRDAFFSAVEVEPCYGEFLPVPKQ